MRTQVYESGHSKAAMKYIEQKNISGSLWLIIKLRTTQFPFKQGILSIKFINP